MPTVHNRNAATQALSPPRLYFSRLSLQARFLLIMGASTLAITLLLWAVFNSFTEHLIERIGARFTEKQMLYDKARTLQPLIHEKMSADRSAENPLIRDWVSDERNQSLYERSMAELYERFHGDNFFVAIVKSGHFYYFDTDRQRGLRPLRYTLSPQDPDDAWMLDFIKSGENHGIKVLSNSKLGVAKIWVMVAIRKANKIVGVLGTGVDLGKFTRNASNIHLPGVTNMFIDRDAAVQIYNDVNYFSFPGVATRSESKNLHIQIMETPSSNRWVRQTIKNLDDGTSGLETEFVHIDGKRYLAGMIALPEAGWYDLTLLDMSVLMPRTDLIQMALAIAAGTLGLLLVLAFSLHKLVLKPVEVLSGVVSRIRSGDYSSNPLKDGSGEFGELATELQKMVGTISNTQYWLNAEIDKRTRQLSDAQKVLEIAIKHEKDGRETQANLMALMAHEMRSPIAVISNTSQMLDMLAQTERPEWRPRIEKILRSIRQLAALMDTFLSEKWLDMDKHGLNRAMGDINDFCAEVAECFSESHHRPIRIETWHGNRLLCADWQLLKIAVLNLLDNADKYSTDEGHVHLKVFSEREDMMCIQVSDHGIGIPPDLQPQVFNKFARGRHDSGIQGSGIGLYLVNWIARFHGGYTEVISKEGEGSTFRLCLPFCEPEPSPLPAA